MGFPIRDAWRQAFRPRDTRPIYDWAREHVKLPPALSKSGAFEVAGSRHFIGPFDALHDPHVREVNVLAPPRDGKTLIADIWLPWIIENDPGAFLGVFQKDDIAKEHCELRTRPILRSVPGILERWPRDYRDRLQEMLFAEMPVFIWGPAINNLQSKGFRYAWLDESWLYKKGTIGEAKARLGDFVKQGIDKLLCTSQGGFAEDVSETENKDWFDQFSSGELNEWHVCCRGCGKYHAPVWSGEHRSGPRKGERFGMVWDDLRDDRGQWQIEACKKTLRYVCPLCAHEEKAENYKHVQEEWNATGEYRVIGERNPAKKSFHWNKIITFPWLTLLDTWLMARNAAHMGDRKATIQFRQKELAEFHNPRAAEDDYERLTPIDLDIEVMRDSAEPIQWRDPATEKIILFKHRQMEIDVQMREVFAVVDAWSDEGDDITLWAERLESWQQVSDLQKRWHVPDDDVCIDVNYQFRQTECARECCRHGSLKKGKNKFGEEVDVWTQWVAYIGSPKNFFEIQTKRGKPRQIPWNPEYVRIDPCPNIAVKDRAEDMVIKAAGRTIPRMCKAWLWCEPTITDILDDRIAGRAKSVRSVIAPGEWNEEFSKHLSAEKTRMSAPDARGRTKFERYKTRADHFRDGKKMSIVHAIRRRRLNIAGYETADPDPLPSPGGEG